MQSEYLGEDQPLTILYKVRRFKKALSKNTKQQPSDPLPLGVAHTITSYLSY